MKTKCVLLVILLLVFGMIGTAQATLLDVGDSVVYDDVNDQYWFNDPGEFTMLSYGGQVDKIEELVVQDSDTEDVFFWGEWRMATREDIIGLTTNPIDNVKALFLTDWRCTGEVEDQLGWIGRYDEEVASGDPDATVHKVLQFYEGTCGEIPILAQTYEDYQVRDELQQFWVGAWVVADPVPEPTTFLLTCAGLVGLAFFRSRKKRTHITP